MQTKRILAVGALVATAALLTACSSTANSGGKSEKTVAVMLPGTTGDGGFFDQTAQGLDEGAKATGWNAKLVQAGYTPTKWQPALDDLSNGDAKLIITGSFAMLDMVQTEAGQHPDKHFVMFDAAVDKSKCSNACKNVFSITYRYDQDGFLAGALAGLMESTSGIERIKQTKTVGVVGGQDIPVIEEYIKGFKQGVKAVAPDVKVLSAFAGSFNDPVKGKAVATDMVNQGAEVLYTAAGATDQGVIEAAADGNVWAIGNAKSQAEGKSAQVNGKDAVITAADTNIISSISDAIKLEAAGKLPVGKTRSYGVNNGAVAIIDSATYTRVVPQSVRDQIAKITADMKAGKYDKTLGSN